jgi:hypothetical protein
VFLPKFRQNASRIQVEKSAFVSVMETQTGLRGAEVCCFSVLVNVNTGVVEKLHDYMSQPQR